MLWDARAAASCSAGAHAQEDFGGAIATMQNRTAAAHASRLGSALGRLGGLALFALLSFAAAGCNKLKARDMLNQGVQAYKANQFDTAIEKFKQATALDPSLQTARLYLATAYANQYIPGSPDEANVNRGKEAIKVYKEVLERDPNSLAAIDGIGSMLYHMAGGPPPSVDMMKESRSYHLKHIQIKPDDPDPYYWVGRIDWELIYKPNKEARDAYNREQTAKKQIKDDAPLPEKLRESFAVSYSADADQGIDALKKAIQLRPDYDDAMGMLNLLYRQKADMVESPDERAKLIENADGLVKQAIEIKQKKASQPATPSS
jgi:tetratricopeptide (TPR) repeat protein